jgi:hypothetical protein
VWRMGYGVQGRARRRRRGGGGGGGIAQLGAVVGNIYKCEYGGVVLQGEQGQWHEQRCGPPDNGVSEERKQLMDVV